MTNTKISLKILELMRQIPNEQSFPKLNESLISLKLITKTKYQVDSSIEIISVQGVVWHYVTVSCELTIIDTESGEEITNVALGSGLERGVQAVAMAQGMAQRYAWLAALNIPNERVPEVATEPEIVVETPESKLIAQIKALWKWGDTELESYFIKKRGKGLSELNLPELTVEKNELESYIRGNV